MGAPWLNSLFEPCLRRTLRCGGVSNGAPVAHAPVSSRAARWLGLQFEMRERPR